jgi:hypothetical protein
MKLHKTLYTSLILLSAVSLTKGQEVKNQEKEKVVSEEIEIIRPYKPVLAEAFKLRRSPDLENIKTYRAKFNYNINDRKLELNSDIQKLQAQQLAQQKQAELVNNYVKGGVGSLGTLLAEAYIATGKDQALQAAGFFRHFSQEGKLNKQNENFQQLSAFGRSIGDKATLNGRVNYERHGLYFYGIDEANPTLNPNPEKQALNFFELEGEVINKFTPNENALNYTLKANVYFFKDNFEAKEQALALTAYLNKRIKNFNTGLAANAEFGSSKDALTSVGNNILRLNPYLKLQTNGVNITAGINITQEFGQFSRSKIFPKVTADFTLIPEFLQLFGEIKGDVNRNTLKDFTDENPFLNSNINIQNTVEKLSISGGIKGNGGPGFGYKARFYSKKIVDMPLFVNNFNTFNKFDVIYDSGTLKLLGIEGEIAVQISDGLKWTGKLNIEDYKPASEQASFFKPQMRASSNLLYTFNNKLTLNANVVLQSDSKAKVYVAQPQTLGSYPTTPDILKEKVVNVGGFVDLGLGADYKINKKFSAFAKANNILNTNYSRYLYYRNNGLNIFGGVTYAF